MSSYNTPVSHMAAHHLHLKSTRVHEQTDHRGVTDLIALTVCPRNAHFFSEGRYPTHTPAAMKGRLLHRTFKNLHGRYQAAQRSGDTEWIPDETIAMEEYHVIANAAKMQGYPPLPFKQNEQLQAMLRSFHTIEARWFYPRIQAAEVPLSWLWKDAPGRPVLLEGKVDVIFTNDKAGIALWDYKTTKQPPKGSHEFQTYQQQMKLYAFLYRQCYTAHPQETALYFLQELAGRPAPLARPPKTLYQVPATDDDDVLDWLYDVLKSELDREHQNTWNPPEEVPRQVCLTCGIRMSCASCHAPFPWEQDSTSDESLEPFEL